MIQTILVIITFSLAAGFLLKIRRDPTFAFEMIQQLSQRVKVTGDRILGIVSRLNLKPEEIKKILQELDGKM